MTGGAGWGFLSVPKRMPDTNVSGRGDFDSKRTGGTEHNVEIVHWSYQVDKQHSGDVGSVGKFFGSS